LDCDGRSLSGWPRRTKGIESRERERERERELFLLLLLFSLLLFVVFLVGSRREGERREEEE
jgi:hypothetical protein